MFLDEEAKLRLKVDPTHVFTLIENVKSKNDFNELAPYLTLPFVKRLIEDLLADEKLFNYCEKHSYENFIVDILCKYLSNIKYPNLNKYTIDILSQWHARFPNILLTALDETLKNKNELSQSYQESGNTYIPLQFSTETNNASAIQIMQNVIEMADKNAIAMADNSEMAFIQKKFNTTLETDYSLTCQEKDILNIIKFLQDIDSVKLQLKKIEDALEERAGSRYDKANKTLADFKPGEYYRHNKLLSGYIKDWAKSNGFKGYTKLKGILTDADFFSILKSQTFFKDNTFRYEEHGQFTHALQLMCIMEHDKDAKNRGEVFLENELIDLIKWMGEQGNGINPPADLPATLKGLWRSTFDEDNPVNDHDFTSPENFNNFLVQSDEAKHSFPILHQLSSGRMFYKNEAAETITKKNSTNVGSSDYEITPFKTNKKT